VDTPKGREDTESAHGTINKDSLSSGDLFCPDLIVAALDCRVVMRRTNALPGGRLGA
jgi:hypothetical protein